MELYSLGLTLILDFISIEEEIEIITSIKSLPLWKEPKKYTRGNAVKGYGRNSIQRFGSHEPYKSNMVSGIIPDFLDKLSGRLVSNNLVNSKPDSVTINHYLQGQQITPHIDSKSSGKLITVLSLGSPAIMNFTKNKIQKESIVLPARSIVQMSGEIRYNWQHSISPVQGERYSIVFRDSQLS